MRPLSTQERAQLESLVDTFGLAAMIDELEAMCYEKAEHIRTNWQDGTSGNEYLAKTWERDGGKLAICSRAITKGPDSWKVGR